MDAGRGIHRVGDAFQCRAFLARIQSTHSDIDLSPVVEELYLSVSGSRATSWWLYDMQGRLLGSGELADTQAVIDFSDKTTGEYVLKITNEVGSRSVLIIKK